MPASEHDVVGVWQTCTPSRNTRYPVTGRAAVLATAPQVTWAVVLLAIAETIVGAFGTAIGVTAVLPDDHELKPKAFLARMENRYATPFCNPVALYVVVVDAVSTPLDQVEPLSVL